MASGIGLYIYLQLIAMALFGHADRESVAAGS